MSAADYHLTELKIACTKGDVRKNLPPLPPKARRVLDIGCGAGQTLLAMELAGVQAVGVDCDFEALRLGYSMTEDICFLQSQGERLPFRAESFDLAFSRVALPYMDIPQALREMARVLRPEGSLWITMHPMSMLSWKIAVATPKTFAFEVYRLFNSVWFALFGKVFRYPLRWKRIESYQSERGMRIALHAAGFEAIAFERGANSFVVTARKGRMIE